MKHIIDTLHHFFVPRHSNNFNAKLLHHDFLTIYLILAILFGAGIKHIRQNSNILGYATDVTIEKLYELTNSERSKNHLNTLNYNEELAQAAREKAADMFAKDYWAHYGPTGETPWQFILGSGYQYEYAGENLAKNFVFSDGVVNAWLESTTHRENLLRKEYTDVGFAVVNGVLNGEETTLVVQIFAKPLYAKDTVAQAPQSAEPETVVKIPATQVLAYDDSPTNNSFFATYLNINVVFFAVLMIALILDFYFAMKLNLIRVRGKNLIHFMFITFVAIGTLIIIRGSIT
ncbi:hypothetical protein A3A93_04540 [Candidatus Roizmanbacteria bacterium RIFCSPLOWO2_01_FULL_38_12]|uniref:SCP domain-containing protein n=1 Tax=Candidatus Roizmanbacteria bacterium RIFCSPLOWO2_01_FULL_38_12 TaxID=1802061 RepID=A0A1F7IVU0_9BACT|nr:MAG: hypothetical protein A2861_00275 [Candidatus Roizmanbacteria bacterium RIFCSPHIGHO2_01_FULL_38_15]OGK36131.1 MAG: hypothetical protein A3F59_01520 [Candidatus Roizmanbacteria bacterium RIFCSPHIGHO2_12_FULL_38_13]OGK47472.1 MAG: hypothetical protein A3A93_04540 [Candidatus Roizmanbacteria bacterium RIFCSPLOWO2_01_FULL_38_12]